MSNISEFKKIVKSKYQKAKLDPFKYEFSSGVKEYRVIEKAERGGVLIGTGKTELEAWQNAAERTLRIIENAR